MITKKWLLLTLLCILLVTLQYRLWKDDGSIQDVVRLSKAITVEQAEVKKLSDRNQQLSVEVQALKAYPETLEERARAELGMIKEGETFYLVLEPGR
jgi:cell division protein FtsB